MLNYYLNEKGLLGNVNLETHSNFTNTLALS